jgi:cysteine-rich repeat protein
LSTCAAASCGDGFVQAGVEDCDDANADETDTCLSTCAAASCGDGFVQAGVEDCDDANADETDTCLSTCAAASCGDGFVQAGVEDCDDGNTTSLDGCNAACEVDTFNESEPNGTPAQADGPFSPDFLLKGAVTPIGDSDVFAITLSATADLRIETFDAGGPGACVNIDTLVTLIGTDQTTELASDDDLGIAACSLISSTAKTGARHLPAGTYFIRVQEFGNDKTIPGYSLAVTLDALCGDGVVEGAEECDGGAGCAATCDRIPVCGDGFVDEGETCDDGNTADGDACSSACALETIPEVEPNSDAATATGAFTPTVVFSGAITPSSDVDFFAITLPATADLKIETSDASGPGSCVGIDTLIRLYAPDGTTKLVERDQGGVGNCSKIDSALGIDAGARHLTAGTYFVSVEAYLQNAAIPGYKLTVSFNALCGNGAKEGAEECDGGAGCEATCDRVAVCGDGFVDGAELCDDGNTATGDGCSDTCVPELTPEVEPNGLFSNASGPLTPYALASGSINPANDVDFFAIDIPAYADLRLEVFDATGPGSCGGGMDTVLTLLAPDGTTQLVQMDDGGINFCSRINSTLQAGARHLAPGTYYAVVEDYDYDNVIAGYTLEVRYNALCGNGVKEGSEECDGGAGCEASCERTEVCGDGYLDGAEACDDGNKDPGDGCDASCAIEAVLEVEPNDMIAQADAGPVVNGAVILSGAIAFAGDKDVFRMDLASAGVVRLETLTSGAGCAATTTVRVLDGMGVEIASDDVSGVGGCSALALYLPAGTYYAQVEEQGNDAALAAYYLHVRFPADGGAESEPNETPAEANAVAGADVYVLGDHLMNGDSDVFAITVPEGRSLRVEIIEGDAMETCASGEIDSLLTLYNASGAAIGEDDDAGRGFCSLIDGTGAPAANGFASQLAGGLYYVQVQANSLAQVDGEPLGQFNYRLVVTIR